MSGRRRRSGLTKLEVLAVIAVVSVLACLLLPAIQLAREKQRRSACLNNLNSIALAFHNYIDAKGSLPPAGTGWGATAGGWSFLVRIMPFFCNSYLKLLPIGSNDPGGAADPEVAADIAAAMVEYHCPSNPNESRRGSIVSYKGIGATCIESLMTIPGSNGSAPAPLYGDLTMHPDGVLFPGKTLRLRDIPDGTAHTLMCVETIDKSNPGSRWLFATDTILVGIPTGSQQGAVKFQPGPTSKGFYAPMHYENGGDGGKLGSENANPVYQTYRTFLAFDFSQPPDADSYPSPILGVTLPKGYYGPSSGHPGLVNHLFVDGSARSVAPDVDVTLYMFLITRANDDPYLIPPDG